MTTAMRFPLIMGLRILNSLTDQAFSGSGAFEKHHYRF
jgi:hypothetical protein